MGMSKKGDSQNLEIKLYGLLFQRKLREIFSMIDLKITEIILSFWPMESSLNL